MDSQKIKDVYPASRECNPQSGSWFWFPGPWVGGISLIVAPVVLLAAILLRIKFHFFFPQQLQAFLDHPRLMVASYSCFVAGNILLWPGIITLSRLIGRQRPVWALWGGVLVILGLFARTFNVGVDHLAFQLVRVQDLKLATKAVADSYGAFHITAALNGAILFGWIILAIGAYLSRTLSVFRAVALACMSALMMGVLKGSSPVSVIAVSGLCIALVPLGVRVLKEARYPDRRTVFLWMIIVLAAAGFLYFLGQQG